MALADTQIATVSGIVSEKLGAVMRWAQRASTVADQALASIGKLEVTDLKIQTPAPPDFDSPDTPNGDGPPTATVTASPLSAYFSPTSNINFVKPGDIPNPVYAVAADVPARPTTKVPLPPTDYPTIAKSSLPDSIDATVPAAPTIAVPDLPTLLTIKTPDLKLPKLEEFDGEIPDSAEFETKLEALESKISLLLLRGQKLADDKTKAFGKKGDELIKAYEETIAKNYEANLALHRKRLMDVAASKIDREVLNETDKVHTLWAARNFSLVPGMAVDQVNEIEIEGGRKLRAMSSEINQAIAKMVAEDFDATLSFYLTIEQCLIELHLFSIRQFVAHEKLRLKAQFALFNALVDLYKAKISVYELQADAIMANAQAKTELMGTYKTLVDGAIAEVAENESRVAIYSSQLQARKAQVDLYNTELRGSVAPIEVYKATLQGVKSQTDTVVANIESYREAVRGYAAALDAATAEIDAYAAQVQAAASGAGITETNARAYATYIQEAVRRNTVYKTFLSEQSELLSANLQTYREAASTGEGYVRVYAAKAAAEADILSARAAAFDKSVRTYASYNKAVADSAAAKTSYDLTAKENATRATALTNQAKAESAKIDAGSLAAKASALAGLAQGAMSAMHVSASAQGTGMANSTYSGAVNWSVDFGGTTRMSESKIQRITA